jgi:LysM repeat protein
LRDCAAVPAGWIRYTVQRGDTASELAASTGLPLSELTERNCIEDARTIVVGQTLYLPRQPLRRPTITPTETPSPGPDTRPTQTPFRDQSSNQTRDPQRPDPTRENNEEGEFEDSGGRGR